MSYWLMKSEPTEYSIESLEKDWRSSWFGIRNYQARNYMRDSMQIWDRVLFYHSNCKIPGIVGVAEVVSIPHSDMTQFELENKYYDPKATYEKPIWKCIDIGFIKKFPQIISLEQIRKIPTLSNMKLLQKGNRLSISPVSDTEYNSIILLI